MHCLGGSAFPRNMRLQRGGASNALRYEAEPRNEGPHASFPGSAWERDALEAPPPTGSGREAEPRMHCVTRRSLVTRDGGAITRGPKTDASYSAIGSIVADMLPLQRAISSSLPNA